MLTEMANELNNAVFICPAGLTAGARDHLQAALFRLEINLPQVPDRAEVRLSAADRYRFYVNGVSVVSGPRKGDRWNHYYESVDIAPYLTPGENFLTARVVSYAYERANTHENAPLSVYDTQLGAAFLCVGEIALPGGETLPLSTGEAGWTAMPDDSFALDTTDTFYVGGTEVFHADRCPAWRENKPMGWPAAETAFRIGLSYWGEFSALQLKARAIPNMEEQPGAFARVLPNLEGEGGFAFDEKGVAVIPAGQTRAVELDAGVLQTAFLRLRAKGQGGCIKLTYAERYFPREEGAHSGPMVRDDREHGKLTGQFDLYYPAHEESVFENFWWRTFRFVRIEVTAGAEDVTLRLPDFTITRYPLNVTAQLDFPDERMAQLWDISVRTLRSCMHETHEDCPYYEQLQYTLDTRLQMQFTYAISGDTRMAENVLWDYHCSRLPDGILQSRYPCTFTQVIPDFAIYWIYMLEEHYIQTGDASLIRFYRPTLDGVLAYFDRHKGATGLVENLGYWEFGDWVEEWNGRAGIPDATFRGPASLHNLTYALGLRTAARLMRAIGKDADAQDYDARADEIGRLTVELCFDETRGLLREGPGFDQYSQHSQALAVLCGALTGDAARTALRHAMQDADVLPCTFPWQYTLFRALEKAGLYELTAPVWQQYFAMLDRHLTTVPEKPGDTRSDCHAWSALPLYEYPRMLLGVQPAAPGWAAIAVRPHAVGVDRMSGTVPTAKGDVHVDWALEGGTMRITVDGPDVPLTVAVNGSIYHAEHGKISV